MTQSPILYDASTDSMYVTLREGRVIHTIAHDDQDFAADIGEDGDPDVIAEALRLLRRDSREAA